ncbi:protein argonaute-2-like [Amblyomma americanum]
MGKGKRKDKTKNDSAAGPPAVPSASGGNQATPPAPSPAGPSRVSFAQALQQGAAASPQPRAVSGGPTTAAEPSAQPSASRPSNGAAAASGSANVAASNPRPASAAAAVSGSQPAAAALPPSPPCTPPVAETQQTSEAGDQATPGDDVRIKELERTLPSHFPRRPAHGQLGRTIQLLANHFSIEIPSGSVYHYDVEISSETAQETKVPEQKKYRCLSTKINRIVIELLVKKYRQDLANCIPAFDGRKNLYTRRQLNFRERTFTVDLEEDQRSQKFIIKIQYAATVNLDALHGVFQKRVQTVPQEVLQAIDIVLRHSPSINLAPVGRSFFRPPGPNEHNDLGGGREVWFGYYTSVRPAQWKPMLNVDMSATAFYESLPLVDFMCRFLSDSRRVLTPADFRSLRENQYVRLNRELKGLRVKVTHLPYPRKYKVVKITREPAKEIYFESEGSQISIADYFQSRYRRLSYPNFPCVQSGSPTHPVYIPLEMCELAEGQHCRKKLDESQTAEMIKRTAQPPAKRFQEIRQSVRDMVSSSDKYLREFGVKINTEPTQVVGRVLDPPSLVFENNTMCKPRDGTWDLRGQRFYEAMSMTKWIVLNVSRFAHKDSLENFVRMLIRIGQELGMRIAQPLAVITFDTNRKPMRTVLTEQRQQHPQLEMVVAVITKDTNYAEIKQVAETELSLRTQCILDNNVVQKCNAALIQNLCKKINAKMGGINNSLLMQEKPKLFHRPVIVIGADVSHPSPGDKVRPSIAACVGSLDRVPSKFHATIRVQIEDSEAKARVEIIRDLKDMIKELLLAFYRATRHKPERIVFYRDGVSEGQFLEVRNHEVSAIRLACKELSPNETYEPALTFIVVQKRHHTRFMPANDRDGVGKCRNVPPGTTVDTVVTHPLDFDFFLCSHFGIHPCYDGVTAKRSHCPLDKERFQEDHVAWTTISRGNVLGRKAMLASAVTDALENIISGLKTLAETALAEHRSGFASEIRDAVAGNERVMKQVVRPEYERTALFMKDRVVEALCEDRTLGDAGSSASASPAGKQAGSVDDEAKAVEQLATASLNIGGDFLDKSVPLE